MKNTKYIHFRKCKNWLSIASLLMVTGCGAQSAPTIPPEWKTDCVGRMQVSLPGEAEIAVTPDDYLLSTLGLAPSKGAREYAFSDGSAVLGYTQLAHSPTHKVRVSQPQTSAALAAAIKAHVNQRFWAMKKLYAKSVLSHDTKRKLAVVSLETEQASAWQTTLTDFVVVMQVGERLVDLSYSFESDEAEQSLQRVKSSLKTFQARPMFTVPFGNGVCLPYTYAQDDGHEFRNIAMTYRLIDHPDIQITIKDEIAARREPGIRTQNAEPLPVIQSLWDQHLTMFAKTGKNEWPRGGKPVTLAGYKGLSSFVKFIRHDDAVDYGYAAVVRGDPNAKEDTPDLMVYVIRDSHNAKGKEPMPKEEFLKMAETIAASVKRRPVSQ